MLLSDFNKVMPLLKYGFYVKWYGEEDYLTFWTSYKNFADKYDFKKIKLIECKQHFMYSYDFEFELVLQKL